MAATLVAVVVALLLSRFLPVLSETRRHDWFVAWLAWLQQPGRVRGRLGFWVAVLLPVALIAGAQWALIGWWWQVPATLFAIATLFYAWGPNDLDHDVERVVDAVDAEARRAHAAVLFPCGTPVTLDGAALVTAVFRCALWRWFGPLFWFIVLGPAAAVAYRLVALSAQGASRSRLPEADGAFAERLLALMDWPVAQLMTLTLALAADFDAVIGVWRRWHEEGIRLGLGYLEAAARCSVAIELADEDAMPADGPPQAPALLELRDAMSLVWRLLILWLGVLALFVLAGFVG